MLAATATIVAGVTPGPPAAHADPSTVPRSALAPRQDGRALAGDRCRPGRDDAEDREALRLAPPPGARVLPVIGAGRASQVTVTVLDCRGLRIAPRAHYRAAPHGTPD